MSLIIRNTNRTFIKNALYKSSLFFNLFRPVKKNTILFNSFYGQYNDNPKYICDSFQKRHSNFIIYWVISDKCHEQLPSTIRPVNPGSFLYSFLICCAEIVVDNHFSCRSLAVHKKNFLLKLVARLYTKKRRSQLIISTWHGTAFKSIAFPKNIILFSNTDYLLLGNRLVDKQIRGTIKSDFLTKIIGSPRNDILFREDKNLIRYLKEKLNLPLNKKIAIYAPTFRNEDEGFGFNILSSINYTQLLTSLENKFGGKWVIVLRIHHIMLGALLGSKGNFGFDNALINGNIGDDMGEYMACSDVLITDYSSSMFDFIITGRPCFIYAPDFFKYKNQTRGFQLDYRLLPFNISSTFADFILSIHNFQQECYCSSITKFMADCGYSENGLSSERANDIIDAFLKYGK